MHQQCPHGYTCTPPACPFPRKCLSPSWTNRSSTHMRCWPTLFPKRPSMAMRARHATASWCGTATEVRAHRWPHDVYDVAGAVVPLAGEPVLLQTTARRPSGRHQLRPVAQHRHLRPSWRGSDTLTFCALEPPSSVRQRSAGDHCPDVGARRRRFRAVQRTQHQRVRCPGSFPAPLQAARMSCSN